MLATASDDATNRPLTTDAVIMTTDADKGVALQPRTRTDDDATDTDNVALPAFSRETISYILRRILSAQASP